MTAAPEAVGETDGSAARVPVRRQLGALFRMELAVLRRDRTALAITVIAPPVLGILLTTGYRGDAAVSRIGSLIVLMGVISVHHHLTSVYAVRREELVLKRLRTGTPSDLTILVGTASVTVALFAAQSALLIGYAVAALGVRFPANPLVVLLALLLGAVVMGSASAAVSALTRTAESAMLTTLPTMLFFFAAPGAIIPFGSLPDSVETLLWYLPMGPFTELIRNGWLGEDLWGPALTPWGGAADLVLSVLVLLAWLAHGALAVHLLFRWEPRTG